MNGGGWIPFLVYLLGPFGLAYFLGRRRLRAPASPFRRGLVAFLVAWGGVMGVTQIFSSASGRDAGTAAYGFAVALAAGLFEEAARYLALRKLRAGSPWNRTVMYAIGHSGMETVIVGAGLLLTAVIVRHAPEAITPELLEESRKALGGALSFRIYESVERLLVGLLIHATFTALVVLSVLRRNRRYLGLAMLWHFGHDVVAFNLPLLSEHWLAGKSWVLFIVIAYSIALRRLHGMMKEGERTESGGPERMDGESGGAFQTTKAESSSDSPAPARTCSTTSGMSATVRPSLFQTSFS